NLGAVALEDGAHVGAPGLAVVAALVDRVGGGGPGRAGVLVAQEHAVDIGASAPSIYSRGVVDEPLLGVGVGLAEGGRDPPALVVAERVLLVAAVDIAVGVGVGMHGRAVAQAVVCVLGAPT